MGQQLRRCRLRGAPLSYSLLGRKGHEVIFKSAVAIAAAAILFFGTALGASAAKPGTFDPSGSLVIRSTNRLYVSDGQASIYVYDAASPGRQPLEVIADPNEPGALAVDDNQWLYVVNGLNNTVGIYKRGQMKAFRTLTQGLNMPTDVAVGDDGMVYVVDYAGDLVTYPKGSTVPSSITNYDTTFAGVAVDAKNDVYATVGGNKDSAYAGVQIRPGSSQMKSLFSTEFGEVFALGLTQDLAGNFVVPGRNGSNSGEVYVYPPGGGELLNNLPLKGTTLGQAAFNRSGHILFASEVGGFGEAVNVVRYEYHLHHLRNLGYFQLPLSSPIGVALIPRMPLFAPSR
jgi:hypothetical protein